MTCQSEAQCRKDDYSAKATKLNEMLDLPFEEKVRLSLEVIEEALSSCSFPVISSSFGKDSVVLTHLVHQVCPWVPVVMNKTGVQYPETLEYMGELVDRYGWTVHTLKPEQTFWEIVEAHGYPKESRGNKGSGDRRAPACCKILKEEPMKRFIKSYGVDLDFIGLLGDEGRQRRWAYILKGSALYSHSDGYSKCIPLIWWTAADVWHYHDVYRIPRNPVYERYGIERTGCLPCTGHIGWETVLARAHPKLYAKIQADRGQEVFTLSDERRKPE